MTLREALVQLLEATKHGRPSVDPRYRRRNYVNQDGVHFTLFDNDVLNFDRRTGGDLNRGDVDWTRAVLHDLGYDIVSEWLPLAYNVSAGVSFQLQVRS